MFIKFSIARGQMGEGKMECDRNVIVMGEDIIDDLILIISDYIDDCTENATE